MNTLVLGVASNREAELNIELAAQVLDAHHHLARRSKFIRTEPIGFVASDHFLNGAFLIETVKSIEEFQDFVKRIEKALGRKPEDIREGICKIDLDIVVWNGRIIDYDFYRREHIRETALELIPGLFSPESVQMGSVRTQSPLVKHYFSAQEFSLTSAR